MDVIFQALAHKIRRQILDFVSEHPGCLSGNITKRFEVSRIAVSKHIKILENANLLHIEKSGRERLHYFNPIPIQSIYERWTNDYSRFFAGHLSRFKDQLEVGNQRADHQQTNIQRDDIQKDGLIHDKTA